MPSNISPSPVTRIGKNLGQLLEVLLVFVVEAGGLGAVDVDNGDGLFTSISIFRQHIERPNGSAHLPPHDNRHNNLTPTLRITGNMPRELKNIRHNNSLLRRSCSPANTLPKSNLLASGFPVEWTQEQELVLEGCVRGRDDYLAADEWGRRDW